ncbi:B9 domain-containing protein 2-like isoform X2 [Onthophagus taurus]|uniref:B9 domain-containing protein 2-like isoform X2 n=1 Tax=Onthophagus taurus TaxID=166361 RepID=UPI0039BE2EFB
MAEVHIVGEISHAKEFPKQELFCRWKLHCGNNWKVISGKQEGQTQVISSEFDDKCWPKIYVQVYHLDWLNRSHLYGYGFVCIPTSPGSHVLNCYTWRPLGSIRERFIQYFLGGGPQLKYPDLILSSNDRYKLNTEAMGVVSFEVNIVLRNFNKFGVEYE